MGTIDTADKSQSSRHIPCAVHLVSWQTLNHSRLVGGTYCRPKVDWDQCPDPLYGRDNGPILHPASSDSFTIGHELTLELGTHFTWVGLQKFKTRLMTDD